MTTSTAMRMMIINSMEWLDDWNVDDAIRYCALYQFNKD